MTRCLGSLSGALMQTLIIPIQGQLPRLLDTDASNASWAVTATLLAAGVTMPVTGRLADMYGKKKVLVASAAVLVLGSLVAALASDLAPFLVGRVLQGTAMGYIPVAISMVREIAPPERKAGAVAAVSATMGVGGAIGLPLSAWIAQDFSWHGLFWFSAALAVVVLATTTVVIPEVHDEHPSHIDVPGIIGLGLGLSAALVGVSKGSEWGWDSGRTLGCIAGGVLVLLEMPAVTGYGLGQSVLEAGLWMAPGGLNSLMRSVGTTIAGAVMAAILTSRTITLGGHVIPDESAFRICFLVGAVTALAGGLVCLLIPRQQVKPVVDVRDEDVLSPA